MFILIILLLLALVVIAQLGETRRTVGIKIHFRGYQNMANTSISFTPGQQLQAKLVAFQASGADTDGAVLSNVVYSVPDASVFTIVTNPDNTALLTPTATATASATLTASATVTDPDGTVGNFTATAVVTVIVAVNGERTVDITLLFTTITPAS